MPPGTDPPTNIQIAVISTEMTHMSKQIEELAKEVRESNRLVREELGEVKNGHDRRIRVLEDEKIRMRTMLLPLSIILSAALSFGTQAALTSFTHNTEVQSGKAHE